MCVHACVHVLHASWVYVGCVRGWLQVSTAESIWSPMCVRSPRAFSFLNKFFGIPSSSFAMYLCVSSLRPLHISTHLSYRISSSNTSVHTAKRKLGENDDSPLATKEFHGHYPQVLLNGNFKGPSPTLEGCKPFLRSPSGSCQLTSHTECCSEIWIQEDNDWWLSYEKWEPLIKSWRRVRRWVAGQRDEFEDIHRYSK